MKFDLHCHTIYSKDDGLYTPREMIKAAVKKGLDGIAITDHDTVKGSLVALKEANYFKNFKIITGCEIKSVSGDILALGIKENVPRKLSIEETVEKIHDLGGIAIAAHPFSTLFRQCVKKEAVKTDAIEIFNATSSNKRDNNKSKELAKQFNKPVTAGSDAHSIRIIGNAGIICNGDPVEDIMNKKVEIFGKYISLHDKSLLIMEKIMKKYIQLDKIFCNW